MIVFHFIPLVGYVVLRIMVEAFCMFIHLPLKLKQYHSWFAFCTMRDTHFGQAIIWAAKHKDNKGTDQDPELRFCNMCCDAVCLALSVLQVRNYEIKYIKQIVNMLNGCINRGEYM